MRVSLGNCCKIEVFGESLNIEKLVPKGVQQNDKKQSQKRSEIRFLRFLGVLGGAEIQTFFRERKKWTENQKKRNFGCQKQSSGRGRRQRVGPVRLWSLKISEILQNRGVVSARRFPPARGRGRRIYPSAYGKVPHVVAENDF